MTPSGGYTNEELDYFGVVAYHDVEGVDVVEESTDPVGPHGNNRPGQTNT